MTPQGVAAVVAMLHAGAGVRGPSEAELATWSQVMAGISDDEAADAARRLAATWIEPRKVRPSDLRREVRAQSHRALPPSAPRRCELCDGTGWVEVSCPPLVVERCRCSPRPTEHPSGCTCHVCVGVVPFRPGRPESSEAGAAPQVARIREALAEVVSQTALSPHQKARRAQE